MSSLILIIFSWFCLLMVSPDVYARKETLVRLRVYVHDIIKDGSESNTTVYNVATSSITSTSPTGFGKVNVVDDLLTAEPSINSTALGRLQGLTTSADLSVSAVALNLNFHFTAGRYNGSSVSILGRNQLGNAERELTVAGGTGAFRFTRGYAIQTTYSLDFATGHGILEFNIYTTIVDPKFTQTTSHRDMEIAEM